MGQYKNIDYSRAAPHLQIGHIYVFIKGYEYVWGTNIGFDPGDKIVMKHITSQSSYGIEWTFCDLSGREYLEYEDILEEFIQGPI